MTDKEYFTLKVKSFIYKFAILAHLYSLTPLYTMPKMLISSYLDSFLSTVDGIVAIYVSDKDGARMAGVSVEDVPEQAFMNYVVTSFISSIQQLPKLGLGEVKHMTTKYQDMNICQFVHVKDSRTPPVYLTIVGTSSCDLGALVAVEAPLRPLLNLLATHANQRFDEESMWSNADDGNRFYQFSRNNN